RAGTPAAERRDRVPPAVVAGRCERLRAVAREVGEAYLRSLLGTRLDVLVEGAAAGRPGWVQGTACRYAAVRFPGDAEALRRRRVRVRAVAVEGGEVVGEGLAAAPGCLALPLAVAAP